MNNLFRKFDDLLAIAGEAEYVGIDVPYEEMTEEDCASTEPCMTIAHAQRDALRTIKNAARGRGEQTMLPDDCGFGDNDLCYVEA